MQLQRFNPRLPFSLWEVLCGLLIAFVVIASAGCGALGQEKPRSAEDGLRYSQATLTGIYTTLGNAAAARSIPAPDARKLYERLEQPDRDLAAADKLITGLPPGGVVPPDLIGKINLALQALQTIAGELRARLPAEQTKALVPVR